MSRAVRALEKGFGESSQKGQSRTRDFIPWDKSLSFEQQSLRSFQEWSRNVMRSATQISEVESLPLDRRNFPMTTEHDAPLSLDRFLWMQSFAERLAELGAPGGAEYHRELAVEVFASSKAQDPLSVAEFVWGQWPTQNKDIGRAD